MTTAIIDAQGKAWDDVCASLRRKLRCPRGVSDVVDFAVNTRGLVALRRREPGTLEVWCRPSRVKPTALVTAAQWMERHHQDRVLLRCDEGEGRLPHISNRVGAIEHLMVAMMEAQSERKGDFHAQRHAPSALAKDAAFGRIKHAWQSAGGAKNEALMEAVREASCGRYLEVVPQDGAARLVMDAVGEGYSLYGNGWKSIAVGGRFEDMPDFAYGRWAAQGYRDAYGSGQPVFEDITAVVRLLRSGTLLLTYRRVILPIGGGEHPSLLLGATLNQRVTRLGIEAGDEPGDVLQ